VARNGLREEVLGELGALVVCEQPANGHATEEVEDGIQTIKDAGIRPTQLGSR
jgi:hypothetical protein